MLEFLDPSSGKEAEFESWWWPHIQQMVSRPGFVRAQPFQRSTTQLRRPSAVSLPSHLTLYFLSVADVPGLERHLKSDATKLGPVDSTSARLFLFRQIGDWPSSAPEPSGDFYTQLVFANPSAGHDDEFNSWYDSIHSHEILAVPGVTAFRRYVYIATVLGHGEQPPRYLSEMDFRTSLIEQFSADLDRAGAHAPNTSAFDGAHAWRVLEQQAGPPINARDPRQ